MEKPKWIYRITHYRNLPFILQNGLLCPNCEPRDPGFTQIGFSTLIASRNTWPVAIGPKGTLGDYVPFYFCIKSPMLYVIFKGNDPEVVGNQDEIIYLVSTVEKLMQLQIPFVFTDRHAKLVYARFSNRYEELKDLNWDIIYTDQWGRQYGEERKELKQAELLAHRQVPVDALVGIGCKTEAVQEAVNKMLSENGSDLSAKIKQNWYY